MMQAIVLSAQININANDKYIMLHHVIIGTTFTQSGEKYMWHIFAYCEKFDCFECQLQAI